MTVWGTILVLNLSSLLLSHYCTSTYWLHMQTTASIPAQQPLFPLLSMPHLLHLYSLSVLCPLAHNPAPFSVPYVGKPLCWVCQHYNSAYGNGHKLYLYRPQISDRGIERIFFFQIPFERKLCHVPSNAILERYFHYEAFHLVTNIFIVDVVWRHHAVAH